MTDKQIGMQISRDAIKLCIFWSENQSARECLACDLDVFRSKAWVLAVSLLKEVAKYTDNAAVGCVFAAGLLAHDILIEEGSL